MFEVPPLLGESHPVDLLLIEVVRMFFPDVYSIVCSHHNDFSGIEDKMSQQVNDRPRCVDRLETALEGMESEHAAVLREILKDLFPRLRSGYDNIIYESEHLARWSREQRISSPEYCLRYFTHSIPSGDITNSEMSAMITMAMNGDVEKLANRISSHFSGPQAGRTIDKFRQVEFDVDPLAAETLALAVARSAERLPNRASLYSFAEPPSQAAAILISHLLQTISDRGDRVSAMESIIGTAKPLWFAAECLRWCRVSDDPEKESKNTLTKQEMEGVLQALVQRVKERAECGHPLFDPDVGQEQSLLIAWRQAEGRNPVQAHLVAVFARDSDQVSRFLLSEVPLAWGVEDGRQSVSDVTLQVLENIDFVIDLDVLADWVRRSCPGNFDEPRYEFDEETPVDRRLAEQFMWLYNERKSNGELT